LTSDIGGKIRFSTYHPHFLGENDFNKYSICGKRARLKDAGQSAGFIRLQIDARVESIKKARCLRGCVPIGKNVIPENRSPEQREGECGESKRSLPLVGIKISPCGRNDNK
jgi:hypothetical protein